MSGDYTKFTFRPEKDYSGVWKQQGRVDLDADWNEYVDAVNRRWRSETIDVIGHCVVPDSTPDAFLITPTGPGAFNIGIGRMYVDGIQVECHGLPPLAFQADLGELRGTNPIPYDDQPYFPAPLPPPSSGAGKTDLVYIVVWEREVTALEDPSIQEIALGGPDTATRNQSVWQVGILADVGPHDCPDQIAAWDDLIAPSAGRLTTSTAAPPPSDDPCIISPSGGYRGLENRLYRVEIHQPGTIGGPGAAKFKWSRDNKSIQSAVTAIPSSTTITVQRIGRDQVLRFDVGNWIEISDDHREFAGQAGHMAQITGIDEANRILTVSPAIPAAMNFDATRPERHTRVYRWDQTKNVDANGLLDVAAGPIELEDGVRVTFMLDPAAGAFKIGDYWSFAARTADGSVELLVAAPPRGILRHYCRLGFITWAAGAASGFGAFTDCRTHWPPPGGDCDCCTVTVGDGVDSHGQFTDIQQAIDALGARGGLVCIGRGVYILRRGLRLDASKRNVILRGKGPATRILYTPDGSEPLLSIEGGEQVRIEDLFAATRGAEAVVRLLRSRDIQFRDCVLVALGRATEGPKAVPGNAIEVVGLTANIEVTHCTLAGAKGVVSRGGLLSSLIVRDSYVLAQQAGVSTVEVAGLEVLHNQFRGFDLSNFPGDIELSRDTVDKLQLWLWESLLAPIALSKLAATGVLVYSGRRAVIADNLVAAQFGVLAFLLIDAVLDRNEFTSLVGVLLAFGMKIRVAESLILGLFAGVMTAGILFDFDCAANNFLGNLGIVFMSTSELLAAFGAQITTALGFVGFTDAAKAFKDGLNTGFTQAGALKGAGMLAVAKIHRNVFVTFNRGIFKTAAVLSGDLSVIDNTFLLCSSAGVDLRGRTQEFTALSRFLPVRHLIQSNAFKVGGVGIITTTASTFIEQNEIDCNAAGIELDAPLCAIRGNIITGTPQRALVDGGLITVFGFGRKLAIEGNTIRRAPGHGILFRESLSDITINSNVIEGAAGRGIGSADDTTGVSNLCVSHNRVSLCEGQSTIANVANGAIVIGGGDDVRLLDNEVAGNNPPGDDFWYAVWIANVTTVEIRGNRIAQNVVAQTAGACGAIGLSAARGALRVQENVVSGNGGYVLAGGNISRDPGANVRGAIQNNYFEGGPNPFPALVLVLFKDSLLFEDNSVVTPRPGGARLATVLLESDRTIVAGNTVDCPRSTGVMVIGGNTLANANQVYGLEGRGLLVAATGSGARIIVTSNDTSGMIISSASPAIRANNIPAP